MRGILLAAFLSLPLTALAQDDPKSAAEIGAAGKAQPYTYFETVTVRGESTGSSSRASDDRVPLSTTQFQQIREFTTNDPFRAVQALPGVAAGDDLRSEFTVRGNAVDHMNFTFEGVPAAFLVHTVQGIHDSGSIAMINGDIVDDVVLSPGSFPDRFGGRTGAELDFNLREGSRSAMRSHGSVSLTDADFVTEGPLGGRHAGSWIVSVRKSYLDRLLRRLDPKIDFAFGFTDAQAKAVYDISAKQQFQVALTTGFSLLNRQPDELNSGDVQKGRNTTTIGVGTWRYVANQRTLVTQKISATVNRYVNNSKAGDELDRGHARDLVYRADVEYAALEFLTFEAGGEAVRSSRMKRGKQIRSATMWDAFETYDDTAMTTSGYGEARASLSRASITIGGRIDRWALIQTTAASPWAQVAVPVLRGVTFKLSGGTYHQAPTFLETVGLRGTQHLSPERAIDTDAALEGRLQKDLRWQITAYRREDRDVIALPASEFKVAGGRLVVPSATTHYQNAWNGRSEGVELLLQRTARGALSGWVSYARSFTKYHDRLTGESFWGDWDQRDTVNAFAAYRIGERYSASSRFRYGSNFPATGYWTANGTRYFVGAERNTLRVKPYSRLDLRISRSLAWQQKRLTAYVEMINLLNRANLRFASAGINGRTFEATGLFDDMFPRIPSFGIQIDF